MSERGPLLDPDKKMLEQHNRERTNQPPPGLPEEFREDWQRVEAAIEMSKADWVRWRAALAGGRFKAFVHSYLTEHSVPEGDPTNKHQIEGCLIGARLDLLFAERDQLRADLASVGECAELANAKVIELGDEIAHLRSVIAAKDAALERIEALPKNFEHREAREIARKARNLHHRDRDGT